MQLHSVPTDVKTNRNEISVVDIHVSMHHSVIGKHVMQTNPSKFDERLFSAIYLCRLRLKQRREIQERETDRRTETDRQRETEGQTGRQADRDRHLEREEGRKARQKQRDRDRQRQRERGETETQRQRHTERKRQRETERGRERDRDATDSTMTWQGSTCTKHRSYTHLQMAATDWTKHVRERQLIPLPFSALASGWTWERASRQHSNDMCLSPTQAVPHIVNHTHRWWEQWLSISQSVSLLPLVKWKSAYTWNEAWCWQHWQSYSRSQYQVITCLRKTINIRFKKTNIPKCT